MSDQSQRQRIFMTGANGYIGSMITTFAIAEGYEVYGLSRSEKGDEKLKSLGAVPVRGDLETLDILKNESAKAQIVIHLADPWKITMTAYDEVLRINAAAVDAMAESLKGRGKLIITSGTLVARADPDGNETAEDAPTQESPINQRIRAEQYGLSLAQKGVDVCAIRLAPYVYGRGSSGVKMLMQIATKNGEVVYVDDGKTKTSVIHVDDAARLYLLACKHAKSGEVFNGTSSTEVTTYDIVQAMGSTLGLPVRSYNFETATEKCGQVFARFMTIENRASNAKAVKQLGWQPREPSIVEDIRSGSYAALAKDLKSAA